ncbi:hypothetical protein [Candidatus Williamhamiltonella defendens]|uniref:hypothetical protein n=1 Tax=Candidatus Williamhamiltonella defendens TaxID=138072 RepID=UPI00037EA05B|nr:hypothetical protein [Candidatus Hamiltonella defensa]
MKQMYKYVNVRVPTVVKDDVDFMTKEIEKEGIKLRKADIYREAIKYFKSKELYKNLID